MHVGIYACMCICMYDYVCMYVCMNVCMYVHVCMYVCIKYYMDIRLIDRHRTDLVSATDTSL